jgi:hypothetical protein
VPRWRKTERLTPSSIAIPSVAGTGVASFEFNLGVAAAGIGVADRDPGLGA